MSAVEKLRYAFPLQKIMPEDHNSLVDFAKEVLEIDKEVSDALGNPKNLEQIISELEAILSTMRYVKYGDWVLSSDHNTLVDFAKKQHEFSKIVRSLVLLIRAYLETLTLKFLAYTPVPYEDKYTLSETVTVEQY